MFHGCNHLSALWLSRRFCTATGVPRHMLRPFARLSAHKSAVSLVIFTSRPGYWARIQFETSTWHLPLQRPRPEPESLWRKGFVVVAWSSLYRPGPQGKTAIRRLGKHTATETAGHRFTTECQSNGVPRGSSATHGVHWPHKMAKHPSVCRIGSSIPYRPEAVREVNVEVEVPGGIVGANRRQSQSRANETAKLPCVHCTSAAAWHREVPPPDCICCIFG